MAEQWKSGQRAVIGFLLDWMEDPYQQMIFEGAELAAQELDESLICFVGGNKHWTNRMNLTANYSSH